LKKQPRKKRSKETYDYGRSRPFDVHKVSEAPQVRHVINHLFDELESFMPKIGKDRKRYRETLKHVVLDLYIAHKEDPLQFLGYSRRKNDYGSGSRYAKLHLTYTRMMSVIDGLEMLGYIHSKNGYFNRAKQEGKQSRMRAEPRLIDLIERASVTKEMVARLPREEIILKDQNKKKMAYEDTPEIVVWRENVRNINAVLSKADVRLDLTEVQWDQYRELGSFPRFDANTLHRTFNNGSFEIGGRFYGHWVQSVPPEYREHLRIDGEKATEFDYSGIHINILYRLEGLDLPKGDVYAIQGYREDLRPLLKKILLISINADTQIAAIRAVMQDPVGRSFGFTYGQVEEIMERFLEHHAPIRHYFNSGKGIELQFIDSQVAERVMLEIVQKGAVCVPVHDSFIVRESCEVHLRNAMERASLEVLGIKLPIDRKY
jgi:hypothetical protein